MSFENPLWLILLIIIPAMIYRLKSGAFQGAIRYSATAALSGVQPTWRTRWFRLLPWLTIGAVFLMALALARPRIGLGKSLIRKEGIDIILTLDVSTSMLAEDFKSGGKRINRLEIVKQVTREFIAKRPNDRIGVVVFAGRPYILAPLTWDHDWINNRINELKIGDIEDGTAIGTALTNAVKRLHESEAESKVVILLTDGNNNAGEISPETAAQAAKELGVTVYTIGAGSRGLVPYPVIDAWGQKRYQMVEINLDEELLQKIADTTGGRYFRATDTESLKTIFQRIDRMEKTEVEMAKYSEYRDLYPYFLMAALGLLLLEAVLANTVCRRLP
ncbi:MAG: VWA domain-containing protein [Firmicutes bacterium]|nr:VWA domain-containing protein [Bacillota bacterium]